MSALANAVGRKLRDRAAWLQKWADDEVARAARSRDTALLLGQLAAAIERGDPIDPAKVLEHIDDRNFLLAWPQREPEAAALRRLLNMAAPSAAGGFG